MTDIVERLRFDSARCEATFSKGVATNIDEATAEIERLRACLVSIGILNASGGHYDPDIDKVIREYQRDFLLSRKRTSCARLV